MVSLKFLQQKRNTILLRGFTVIELIVVVSIFLLITTVTLASYNKFNSETLLTNLALDIGLSLREAQVYGVATRAPTGSFIGRYGLHFEPESTSYVFFVDIDQDELRASDGSEDIETFALQRGYRVTDICRTVGSASEECNPDLSTLDIVFIRPNPDAIINAASVDSSARVIVESSTGEGREIAVQSTGQISISKIASQAVPPPPPPPPAPPPPPPPPMYTWTGPSGSLCLPFPLSPQITPGAGCSPSGIRGYDVHPNGCTVWIFSWTRSDRYRCQ